MSTPKLIVQGARSIPYPDWRVARLEKHILDICGVQTKLGLLEVCGWCPSERPRWLHEGTYYDCTPDIELALTDPNVRVTKAICPQCRVAFMNNSWRREA